MTNFDFRNYLVSKYQPTVFINNAGIVGKDPTTVININGVASADLLFRFYQKMTYGNIINISSWSINNYGNALTPYAESLYRSSKKLISSLSTDLARKKEKEVLVTSIEPQIVNTQLLNKQNKVVDYTNYQIEKSVPMTAEYIAEVIEWIILQPRWVTIEKLTLGNSSKYPGGWLNR